MQEIGKTLIVLGVLILGLGLLLASGARLPFFGRLPGDMLVQKKHFTFYFPLLSCLLLSVVLSLVFYFFNRR